MTIKKMMMAAGAIAAEPQVIAPSSNDWDYTFSRDSFPAAGNALGDSTSGGFVDDISHGGIFSLHTFDGDFTITFTATAMAGVDFGMLSITEDDHRAVANLGGLYVASAKTAMYSNNSPGGAGTGQKFWEGQAADSEGAHTFADGSVILWERVSGVIKVYDDASLVNTFDTTNNDSMRFYLGNGAGSGGNIDNILFTDTDKIQHDGMFDEGGSNSSYGDYYSNRKHSATLFTATRTGTVTGLKVQVAAVSTAFSTHAELWTHDGTNPAAQVGSDSDSITLSSTGVKNFSFTDPTVVKGRQYWMVMVDESTNGWVAMLDYTAHPQGMGAGRHDTITSIADDWAEGMKMEITVDSSSGEPTPDHDTLLLIHSDTSDASTTFADSSQFGRTITVNGDTQHDTAQKEFGASSMLFDGTGDYLSVPDSADWDFSGNFTVDCHIRINATGTAGLVSKVSSIGAWSGWSWSVWVDGATVYFQVSNNGGGGLAIASSALSTSTWYHIAAVRLGDRFDLYVDGVSVANTTAAYPIVQTAQPVLIGRVDASDGYYFNGWIDEVRISNVARWDANFTAPSAAYP